MQEVYFANTLSDKNAMLFLVGVATVSGGAQWTDQPPKVIQTLQNHPGPYRCRIALPAGDSLAVSYKRTNVTPEAHVNIKIENSGGIILITVAPTDANLLDVSATQNGVANNVQVILNFTGQ